MEGKDEGIEIRAVSPSFFRLASSALFDALTVVLLAFLLSLAVFPAYFSTTAYTEPTSFREEIMLASRLYEKKDGGVALISSSLTGDSSLTFLEKSAEASDALSYCYRVFLNDEFGQKGEEKLNSYLASCTYEGSELFGEDGTRLLSDGAYDEAYFKAYCEVIEKHGAADLNLKEGFSSARNKILWGYFVSFLIAFSLSCCLLLLLVPLCLKKGKKTFGMLLTKLAYLDPTGLSPTWKRWVLRFFFQLVLILGGAFFTFGATLVFSCVFSAWRKDHQCVSDYVFALYPVDASQSDIHESADELLKQD